MVNLPDPNEFFSQPKETPVLRGKAAIPDPVEFFGAPTITFGSKSDLAEILPVLNSVTGYEFNSDVLELVKSNYLADGFKKYDMNKDWERITSGSIPSAWDKNYKDTELDILLYEYGLPSADKLFSNYSTAADAYTKEYEKQQKETAPKRQYDALIATAVKNADKFNRTNETGEEAFDFQEFSKYITATLNQDEFSALADKIKTPTTYSEKTFIDDLDASQYDFVQSRKGNDPVYSFQQMYQDFLTSLALEQSYEQNRADGEANTRNMNDYEPQAEGSPYEVVENITTDTVGGGLGFSLNKTKTIEATDGGVLAPEELLERGVQYAQRLLSDTSTYDQWRDVDDALLGFTPEERDHIYEEIGYLMPSEFRQYLETESEERARVQADIDKRNEIAKASRREPVDTATVDEVITRAFSSGVSDEEAVAMANEELKALGMNATERGMAFTQYGVGTFGIIEADMQAEMDVESDYEKQQKTKDEALLSLAREVLPQKIKSSSALGGMSETLNTEAIEEQEAVFRNTATELGYTQFDIDNALRVANYSEFVPAEVQEHNYAVHNIMKSGYTESEAETLYSTLDAATVENLSGGMQYDNDVHESLAKEAVRSVVSIPLRAGTSIVSGIVGAADLIMGLGDLDSEQSDLGKWAMEANYKMQQYGTSGRYKALDLVSDVGSEVVRMYLLSAAGKAIAGAGGMTGASLTTAQKGADVMLKQAAKYAVNNAPFLINATGNYYSQALSQGANRTQATQFAIYAGTIEGSLEAFGADLMFNEVLSASLTSRMMNGARDALTSPYAFKAAQIMTSAVGNALEEGTSYALTGLLQHMIYDPDWKFDSKEMLNEALMGGLIGGVGAMAGSAKDSRAYAIWEKMLDEGYSPQLYDAGYFAALVEGMPQSKIENLARSAAEMNLSAYVNEVNTVYKSVQAMNEATVNHDTHVESYNTQLSEAQAKVESFKEQIASLDQNDPNYIKRMNQLSREIADANTALAKTEKSVAAKISQADKEYKSVRANNEYARSVAQKKVDECAVYIDLMNQYTEAQNRTHDAELRFERAVEQASSMSEIDAGAAIANAYAELAEAIDAEKNVASRNDVMAQETGLRTDTITQSVGAATRAEIMENAVVSKVFANTLANRYGMDGLSEAGVISEDALYNVMPEAIANQNADAMLANMGIEERSTSDVANELADRLEEKLDWQGSAEVKAAMKLLDKLKEEGAETGDYSAYQNLSLSLVRTGTDAGQIVQAYAEYGRTSDGMVATAMRAAKDSENNATPKQKDAIQKETDGVVDAIKSGENVERKVSEILNGKKDDIQAIMDLIESGNATPDKVNEIIKQRNGVRVVTSEDIQNILNLMELSDQQTDEYQRKRYRAQAAKIVANKMPSESRFRQYRRIMMLLNPRTIVKNFAANIPMGILENLKDIPATFVDMIASKATGNIRTTNAFAPKKYSEQMKGMAKGTGEAFKDIRYGVDTSGMPGRYDHKNQYEGVSPDAFKSKVFNDLVKTTNGLMQLGDRGFFNAAFDGRLAELDSLGYDIADSKVLQDAELYALDRVFQNDSGLSRGASKVRNALGTFGDLAIPFTQTPANIADKLLDYTPAGMARAVIGMGKQKKSGTFDQKLFVDRAGRSLTGTGLMALGAALSKAGVLKADEEKNEKERQMLKNAGVANYALHLGDTTYSIDWAEPAGSLLLMGAKMKEIGMSIGEVTEETAFNEFIDIGLDVGATGINAFFNNTFLQNIASLMSGYDPGENMIDFLMGSTSQFTPSALSATARAIDPYERETYDPNRFQNLINTSINRVPFLRQTLPEKVNTGGQVVDAGSPMERVVQNFISPGTFAEETTDPVHSEIYRLYQEGMDDQILPVAEKKIDGHTLSAEQYSQYKQEVGEAVYTAAQRAMNSSGYKTWSDEGKANAIGNAVSSAKTAVKNKWKSSLKKGDKK
ncbi:hypothetical protein LJC07_04000 [Christensenellaceae bacterium OttesenSCG-928-L17]|nr:hypothetical protein [Christensenellaceae bacterium OttesenSCG-928-L17]